MKSFTVIIIVAFGLLEYANSLSCDVGNVLSADGSQCLPYVTEYNGECSENAQCKWLGENSHCNYYCKCKEGYRWYLGSCRPYVGLGENCTNLDCFDGYTLESLTCSEGKCVCSEDYYQRGDTDCRKNATTIGGICALDIDCHVPVNETNPDEGLLETVCHIGKCQEKTQSVRLFQKMTAAEEEEPNLLYAEGGSKLSCSSDTDCSDIQNTQCFENSCVCKAGYFFGQVGNETRCIPELGMSAECTKDSECLIKPGKCVNGTCYCRDYYFVGDGNRNCIKTMSENNKNCLSKEWCYAFGKYSYCDSSESCQCSKIAEYDSENELCKWSGKTDPDMCSDDLECKYIQNGFCVDEACGCRKGYFFKDNKCIPNIGSTCNEKIPCDIENSECSPNDNVCVCSNGFIAFDNACYIKRVQGEECDVDAQCVYTYGNCINSTCDCDDRYLGHNGTCYLKTGYGEYCNTRLECMLSVSDGLAESIRCRSFQCQCPTGYTLVDDECTSSSHLILGSFYVIAFVLLVNGVFSIS